MKNQRRPETGNARATTMPNAWIHDAFRSRLQKGRGQRLPSVVALGNRLRPKAPAHFVSIEKVESAGEISEKILVFKCEAVFDPGVAEETALVISHFAD